MMFCHLWCVSHAVCARATPHDFYIVAWRKHFRPALAGGKCFLGPRIHAIFRGGHFFISLFRFYSAIILVAKNVLYGRAFGSHPRGRGFESLQVHQTRFVRTPISSAAISPCSVRSDPQQKSAVLGVIPRRRFLQYIILFGCISLCNY